MIYVFGKALLQSGIGEHVTKHVLRDLVDDRGPAAVRAIWREEYCYDPVLVDQDFEEIMTRAGGVTPDLPDEAVKCGTIEDVLMDGPEPNVPTDAVLAPLPAELPVTAPFGLGRFRTVYVTRECDRDRLLAETQAEDVDVWPMPRYRPPKRLPKTDLVPWRSSPSWFARALSAVARFFRSLWRRFGP